MNRRKIQSVFTKPLGTISLLKVAPDEYMNVMAQLLEAAQEQDHEIIYVCAKLPYVHLQNTLTDKDVDIDGIHIIDTITKTITSDGVVPRPNVTYLSSPQNLQNIGSSISMVMNEIGRTDTLLVVDSIESLLTYNAGRDVTRFIENLSDRTETLDLRLALFKLGESVDEKIGSALYPVVDDIILLSGADERAKVATWDEEKVTIEIPADVARALKWQQKDTLSCTVNKNGELRLKKQ